MATVRSLAGVCVVVLVGGACSPAQDSTEEEKLLIGQVAPWPTDAWTRMQPEEVGMDPEVLEGAFDYAFAEGRNTGGVVVVRGGAIVAERYAEGKDEDDFGSSWSVGKSFMSTLVGMAIEDGKIAGVDVPMTTFYPQWAGTDKAPITLEHVLHMESGLEFVEDYANVATSDVIAMGFRDDVLAYVTDELPVSSVPGTYWYYSSGDTMLLSGAVQQATGTPVPQLARERIFSAIGMHTAQWWSDGQGHALGFCCVDAPPKEFAKFGLLFLRGGEWDGEQIVSERWVETATTDRAQTYAGYAYQWWTVEIDEGSQLPRDLFAARGHDGQRIYVIPSLDLVVIRNSLYEKPPGDPVATGGYLKHFLPGGLGQYGTQAPDQFVDEPFLGPIINSIEGAERIEVDVPGSNDDGGQSGSLVCGAQAMNYAGYCDAVHGCACDLCPDEFLLCDEDPGCREIMECALSIGCRGVGCATPCADEIERNGGVLGGPAMTALALSDCVVPCPTECDSP